MNEEFKRIVIGLIAAVMVTGSAYLWITLADDVSYWAVKAPVRKKDTPPLRPAPPAPKRQPLSDAGEQALLQADYLAAQADRTADPSQLATRLAGGDLAARFRAYRQALAALAGRTPPATGAESLRARLHAARQLRGRYFEAAECAALFGLRDAYDDDALARHAIASDTSASAEQQRARLAALDAARPSVLREEHEAPRAVLALESDVASLRRTGAGEDAVFRLRAQRASPDAAARLAVLDGEEAAWRQRIARYRTGKAALPPGDAAALRALQSRAFTADEQRRLQAYDSEPQ
ncbi:MAG TPA: lipase secretion chaperone [Burkholderiaceae bacterium]